MCKYLRETMPMKNKLIFFYSELYGYYSDHIHSRLDGFFEIEGIQIDNLVNDNKGHTFFGGVSIKIELIIQKIRENMGEFITFSDATIFINSTHAPLLGEWIDTYKEYDLCFPCNGGEDKHNIGFILINCNEKTLRFFEQVLSELQKNRGWDQQVVNRLLMTCCPTDMKVGNFEVARICCGFDFPAQYIDTFLIYKSFIHHSTDMIANFNARLDIFRSNHLISEEEYNRYHRSAQVPPEESNTP